MNNNCGVSEQIGDDEGVSNQGEALVSSNLLLEEGSRNSNSIDGNNANSASLSSEELDRLVMPPPSIKLSQINRKNTQNSITTPSSTLSNNTLNSVGAESLKLTFLNENSNSGMITGVEICILSNTSNEMIFVDPNLVKYSTRLQNTSLTGVDSLNSPGFNDKLMSPQFTGPVNENSPSLIVSPRLKNQHSRWSTYYTSGSTVGLSDFLNTSVNYENSALSITSSNSLNNSAINNASETNQIVPSASLINSTTNQSPLVSPRNGANNSFTFNSSTRNSIVQDEPKTSTAPKHHHHTISSLNKKEFQQFLPRVSLPNYGDISSVFNYSNLETLSMSGNRTSFHLASSSGGGNSSSGHENNFSKSSFFSKSFTFGGDKYSNVSIGTTMTFSSMMVPKTSPRGQEARRLSKNNFSFFGKQYMKEGQQQQQLISSTSSAINLKKEESMRESIVEAFSVQDIMSRRFTDGENIEKFMNGRRSTTSEIPDHSELPRRGSSATPLPSSTATQPSTAKSHIKTLSTDVKRQHERTPSSPLEINTSLLVPSSSSGQIPKTPEKKKSSNMSSKVKEFFSSIGRRSRKKSNADSFDHSNDSSLPPSPPLNSTTKMIGQETNQNSSTMMTIPTLQSSTDLMGTSPFSNQSHSSTSTPPVLLDGNILLSTTPTSTGSRGTLADDEISSHHTLGGNTQSAPAMTCTTSTSLSSSPPALSTLNGATPLIDEVHIDMTRSRRGSEIETPISPSRRRSSMKKSPKRRESMLSNHTPVVSEIDQGNLKYLTNLIVDFKTSSLAFSKLVEEFSLFDSLEKSSVDPASIVQSPLSVVEAPRGTKNRRPTSMHYISSSNTPMGRLSSDLSYLSQQQLLTPVTSNPTIFHCINERSSNFSLIILNDITLCLWYTLENQNHHGTLSIKQKSLLYGGSLDDKLKEIGLKIEYKLKEAFAASKASDHKSLGALKSSKSMEFSFFNKKVQ
ncbi:predicted protein [Naegleria gruberi]|uniref:Predicted protein n=1 Tax=Naegleria gruberi TaxID=5762 RepID=D2V3N9_NAEGR|nr:uncharacterized protein NAEGRDRAFT_63433 [Naegleria gruberi]EFC48671.1 predicted protein [Naegleria gruberi]|eukprot:XP_002681415.1 predicted protein [Naegleria gruberi strain NEG-M]